ncbi:MAG: pilus assembly protein PilY, partial [Hydrogenobacter sp.]
ILFIQQAKAANMTDYCYTPPYVATAVSPNVMLTVDVSGSMSWCAYNPSSNKQYCCSYSSGCGWKYEGDEEGYFDPSKVYRYNSSQGYWEETTGTPASCPKTQSGISTSKIYQGSCLNFLYMSRIDLVRWALTGGTPDSCPTGINRQPGSNINKCDPETYGQPGSSVSCDSYGCILKSTNGIRVKVPWSRINSALLFQLKNLSLKPR